MNYTPPKLLTMTTPAWLTLLALAKLAALTATADNGNTDLYKKAAKTDNPIIITALLEAGADPKAKTEDGKTPWDYTKENEALKGTDAYWLLNDLRF